MSGIWRCNSLETTVISRRARFVDTHDGAVPSLAEGLLPRLLRSPHERVKRGVRQRRGGCVARRDCGEHMIDALVRAFPRTPCRHRADRPSPRRDRISIRVGPVPSRTRPVLSDQRELSLRDAMGANADLEQSRVEVFQAADWLTCVVGNLGGGLARRRHSVLRGIRTHRADGSRHYARPRTNRCGGGRAYSGRTALKTFDS